MPRRSDHERNQAMHRNVQSDVEVTGSRKNSGCGHVACMHAALPVSPGSGRFTARVVEPGQTTRWSVKECVPGTAKRLHDPFCADTYAHCGGGRVAMLTCMNVGSAGSHRSGSQDLNSLKVVKTALRQSKTVRPSRVHTGECGVAMRGRGAGFGAGVSM